LAVVVASFRGLEVLESCLASLREQCRQAGGGAELIVARPSPGGETGHEAVTEGCRVVLAPAGAGIPELRGTGLAAAEAEWVAVTEDHCVAADDWIATLLAACEDDVAVLGGSMGNAQRDRAVDCGAYLAEYGFYGATGRGPRSGAAPLVTQANAMYHRRVVDDVARWAREGSWENVIHDRLHAAGHRFRLVPEAVVRQNLRYGFGAFCRDRFAHGRAYAETRADGMPGWRRGLLAAATPALPAMLGFRILRAMRPAERRDLPRGLPAMLCFLSAWAAGEAAGYLTGSRG
jgi:GT2 family glycosyltransferase